MILPVHSQSCRRSWLAALSHTREIPPQQAHPALRLTGLQAEWQGPRDAAKVPETTARQPALLHAISAGARPWPLTQKEKSNNILSLGQDIILSAHMVRKITKWKTIDFGARQPR